MQIAKLELELELQSGMVFRGRYESHSSRGQSLLLQLRATAVISGIVPAVPPGAFHLL